MSGKIQIRMFTPDDAAATVALYRAVYGEEYPVKSVYDENELIRQHDCGDTYRLLAVNDDGEAVGQIALYRSSPPNRRLYEVGQMIIRHDYRQSGVAFSLFPPALTEIPAKYGLEAVWGEAVCNHLFTQQMAVREGVIETGIEIALMPAEAGATAMNEQVVPTERGSVVVGFLPFRERLQTIFVPTVYEEAIKFAYDGTYQMHEYKPAEEFPPPGTLTTGDLETFPGAGVARMTFSTTGEDFEQVLVGLESEASASGAVVTQAYLRLTDPGVGGAVSVLRRRGYFFGAVLLRWFEDDGLLLQKLLLPPDFDAIHLYTKRARQLLAIIRRDFETVCPATVGGLLRMKAADSPEKPLAIWASRDKSDTYATLDCLADQTAKALMALGIGKGEHAAVWAANVPEYLPVIFGCARAGVPLVTINPGYRSFDLEYALNQADVTVLFLADGNIRPGEYIEVLRQVRERLPTLRHIVSFSETIHADMMSWRNFLAMGIAVSGADLSERESAVSGNDIFLILYTSGTTGLPKPAMTSHQAYVCNMRCMMEREGFRRDDILCLAIPLFHAYGFFMLLSVLWVGGTLLVLERFQPVEMLRAMARYRATVATGTPTMYALLTREVTNDTYDLSAMRAANMGGALCPPELAQAVAELLRAPECIVAYGSTEGLCVFMNPFQAPFSKRTGTVGCLMPGYAAKIINIVSGEPLLPGGQGELCIKGPGVMTGYYKLPAKIAETIDEEGWMHTGDIACVDDDGYYTITGRVKDVIIRGGENVFPSQIEAFLQTHTAVLDAQVVGIPCEYYGEDVAAFVRLKPGEKATALELKKYCRERIALNMTPAVFFFLDEYPINASGKVQKFKLRELAQTMLVQDKN